MTIPEAVSLVLQSVAMGEGGEIFVLDMGDPVKILDLAKRMISLNGHTLGVDMDISFIGLRPGEKLYEELFNGDELIEKTPHPKINKAISKRGVNVKLVELLTHSIVLGDNDDVRNTIVELIE
jgi:FlaA1/EpsC-like NDP-sugar epimerase